MKYIPVLFAALLLLAGCEPETIGGSDFAVSPSSLVFGNVAVSSTARLTVTIVNNSGAQQYPLPSVGGIDATAFRIVYQPDVLLDGEKDSVIVEFAPQEKRDYLAHLEIGLTSPLKVSLVGKGVDPSTPHQLSLACNHTSQSPILDGSGSDAAWANATELTLDLTQVQTGEPQGSHRARIRSVNDGTYLYFLVRIDDPTQNDSPNQLQFAGGDPGAESDWTVNTNGQDAIGFMFASTNDVYGDSPSQTFAAAGCNTACHQAQSLLNYESGSYPGNGTIDIWHWQAGITNPQGYADDQTASGGERRADAGSDFATPNFVKASSATPIDVAGGDNRGWEFTRHLWAPTSAQFNPAGSNPATGMPWVNGDIVPGWRLADNGSAQSRNNVQATGVYSGGSWVVEFKRPLNTGRNDDASFTRNSDVPFSFAYFDNARKYTRFEYTALKQKPAPSHYGSNPRVIYLLIR